MIGDLLKSVREVRACEIHLQTPDQYHLALWNARSCEDCLRLVLAHCGENAEMVLSCSCDSASNCVCVARCEENIRSKFGVEAE